MDVEEIKEKIEFGLHAISQPETAWQEKLLDYTKGQEDNIYKPVILWRTLITNDGRPTQSRLRIPGVVRFFYEPINPFDEEIGTVLMAVLYFEDYSVVEENLPRWQVEEALQGFRVQAALMSRQSSKAT